MDSNVTNLIKSALKGQPVDVAKKVFSKLGTVKSVEDVAAVFAEYKIDLGKDVCATIFDALSMQKGKALSDEDLELVTGGCDDDWSGC